MSEKLPNFATVLKDDKSAECLEGGSSDNYDSFEGGSNSGNDAISVNSLVLEDQDDMKFDDEDNYQLQSIITRSFNMDS